MSGPDCPAGSNAPQYLGLVTSKIANSATITQTVFSWFMGEAAKPHEWLSPAFVVPCKHDLIGDCPR